MLVQIWMVMDGLIQSMICQWIRPFGAIQMTMVMVTTLVVTLLTLVPIHLERQPLIDSDVWMLVGDVSHSSIVKVISRRKSTATASSAVPGLTVQLSTSA